MLSDSQKAFLTQAAEKYHQSLADSPAIGYLENRGLIDLALNPGYLLGYVADPEPGHEKMKGRLAIPYVTPSGVVNIKARCIAEHDCKEEDCPKYRAPLGSEVYLFNVGAFKSPLPYLGIAEGEIDALALAQGCGIPAVGVPGSDSWKKKPHWRVCFEGYDNVWVFADPDEAGEKLVNRICNEVANASPVRLPAGEDVSECFRKYGAEYLRRLVGL